MRFNRSHGLRQSPRAGILSCRPERKRSFERTTKFDSASILVTRLYAGMSLLRLEAEGRRPEGGVTLQTPFSAELFPSARQKSATGKFSTPMSAELFATCAAPTFLPSNRVPVVSVC